jgi:hypothetical protein
VPEIELLPFMIFLPVCVTKPECAGTHHSSAIDETKNRRSG